MGEDAGADVIISGISNVIGAFALVNMPLRVQKAAVPTVTLVGTWALTGATAQPSLNGTPSRSSMRWLLTSTATGSFYASNVAATTNITAEANP
jgi:hypothetical protein